MAGAEIMLPSGGTMSRFVAVDTSAESPTVCAGTCCVPSRRGFLRSLAAAASVAAAPKSLLAQAAPTPRPLIDIHHHFYPPEMKQALAEERGGRLAPMFRDWTPAKMLDEMDRNGVTKSVISLSTAPMQWFRSPLEPLRKTLRAINENGARIVADHPGRFGQFAFVSMKDVDGSLTELAYALDTLKVDGIGIATSYGDTWPGDPLFAPIFEELDRRRAVVHLHPIAPNCCGNLVPDVADSWLEYPTDSVRAALSLLFSGALKRFPNIKFIFSHGGGTLPMLVDRVEGLSKSVKNRDSFAPNGIAAELQKLHFDTADATSAPALAAISKFAPVSQLLFGTDFPYVGIAHNLAGLRSFGLAEADLRAVESQNAVRLMPRLG
jgi:predicted TIM-barrel fold metal-dependent hydrolase